MKVQKAGKVGIVVSDQALSASQTVDGRLVTASVVLGRDFKRSLKQLLAASPFVGKDVVIGIEGSDVLVESLVVPSGASKSVQSVCAERLKGDPVFNDDNAAQSVAVASAPSGSGPSMVIHAAVVRSRIAIAMRACRELELQVHAVEAAALASWRAWSGSGLQARLVRTETADIVLAGSDSKLLFCRIVDRPIAHAELSATVSRAASLLATERFDVITCSGIDEAERQEMARVLGTSLGSPPEDVSDAAAAGLAADGVILTEFTPPEERSLRVKRRLRRVRVLMSSVAGLLVLTAGLLGYQQIGALEQHQDMLNERLRVQQGVELELAQQEAALVREQTNAALLVGARPGHFMSRLFSIVANSAPENVLLESIKIEDVADPSFQGEGAISVPRRLTASLHGLAGSNDSVGAFADSLIETGAFADVRIEASERVILGNGTGGERFRIFANAETR